ncbi:MAG: diguanylate cyclase [Arcobacteraceae bacterium]
MINKEILQNIKVLYVEDEVEVRNFTAKTIQAIVKELVVAENGQDGVEKFKQNQDIDLIVTDINMPKMGGLEMCEAIQEINPNIPIVITSAHNDPDFLKKAIDIGVDAYAMKPVDLYQLLDCMIKAMEPIFLRKQLEQLNLSLESKVEEGIKKIKLILDAQDNMVIVTNGITISHVNKRFLDFFNKRSLEEYLQSNQCIYTSFKKEPNFFHQEIINRDESWIESIQKLPEIQRVVKLTNQEGEDRVFTVKIHQYDQDETYYVISLTDITQIKQKSNLLEYQANHDALTGLYNRQKFNDIFTKEIRRSRRYANFLSVILFDIDNFKAINDSYGHDAGDEVLKKIADIISVNLRQTDSLVRWGGEEFIVLLPETDLQTACNVAQKLLESLTVLTFDFMQEKITASFGVATLNETDTECTLINRADEALYEAKRNGKNQVLKEKI